MQQTYRKRWSKRYEKLMPVSLKAITPKKFKLIDPTKTTAALRTNMRAYLELVKKQLQEYPPQKNFRYVRKYNLKRGWNIVMSPDGTDGQLVNGVKYAVFVQGPRGGKRGRGEAQLARMRKLGWPSITDVARRTRPLFPTVMNRALKGSRE